MKYEQEACMEPSQLEELVRIKSDQAALEAYVQGRQGYPRIPEAVPLLIDLLGNINPKVRHWAGEVISEIGEEAKAATPFLITALQDPDDNVCRISAWALGNIGADAKASVPALVGILRNKRQN